MIGSDDWYEALLRKSLNVRPKTIKLLEENRTNAL